MMEIWRQIAEKIVEGNFQSSEPAAAVAAKFDGEDKVYSNSIHIEGECGVFLVRQNGKKSLVLVAQNPGSQLYKDFDGSNAGEVMGRPVKIAALDSNNAKALRRWFSFTSPIGFGRSGVSMGLGDRLGLASPGHLHAIKGTQIRPVLAQQSIRELNLTHRTYTDVLDAASWAVFQEGYHLGFGADGDHLKKPEEVKMALDLGYSMITLDCSEKIDNSIDAKSAAEVMNEYSRLPGDIRKRLEQDYVGKIIELAGSKISFDAETLARIVLTYGAAMAYTQEIFAEFIKPRDGKLDFELSIDETATPTTLAAHYFVATELVKMGIVVTSVAPRFIGEFQKAIDYIGDLGRFEAEFKVHAAIADHFGYRLSVHSGSDKFAVYPVIGRYTKGRVHVKTAGTNWLEALRVICRKEPDLFRRICGLAVKRFPDAAKFYHVTTDLSKVPEFAKLPDKDLEQMLEQPDARQLLHITYGYILTDQDATGRYVCRDDFFKALEKWEDEYAAVLREHIGKHIRLLTS